MFKICSHLFLVYCKFLQVPALVKQQGTEWRSSRSCTERPEETFQFQSSLAQILL